MPALLKRDDPIVSLERKFQAWILQQPEWLSIVAMPRVARRAAMKELAKRLYLIPTMDGVNTVPRQVIRKARKQLAHAALTEQLTEQVKEALAKAAEQQMEEQRVAQELTEYLSTPADEAVTSGPAESAESEGAIADTLPPEGEQFMTSSAEHPEAVEKDG